MTKVTKQNIAFSVNIFFDFLTKSVPKSYRTKTIFTFVPKQLKNSRILGIIRNKFVFSPEKDTTGYFEKKNSWEGILILVS